MTRRVIVSAMTIVTLVGVGGSAFAGQTGSDDDGRHEICLMGSDSPSGSTEGFCVWVPTSKVTP